MLLRAKEPFMPAEPASVPPLDLLIPEHLETATFASG